MNQRIVDFIAALRAGGVRVSLAESADALRAIEHVGVMDREAFRLSLKTTLVKDAADGPTFDQLFPLYFGSGGPPMLPPQLAPNQMQSLREAMRDVLRRLNNQELAELVQRLLEGRDLSRAELERLGQQAGLPFATSPYQQEWITRRMLQAMGLDQAQELLQELWAELARRGMDRQNIRELQQLVQDNQDALSEQVSQYVGAQIARQQAEEQRRQPSTSELMHRPFDALSERELKVLRDEVRRLAARLRTRISLRRRRGKTGALDAKATLRANQRYGGVPIDLRLKRRRRKARLVLICDLSTSMRPVVEFLLRLVYELQDQVAHTHSFAFIDHLEDISEVFAEQRPEAAIEFVLVNLPPGHYNTDLGASLAQFVHDKLETTDPRTTVILLGDGRNNYNDPRLDAFETIKRHSRRLIWLNPEPPGLWGDGDSDMLRYIPYCSAVHQVATLAQLTWAIDQILGA